MHSHVTDALKTPRIVQLSGNLFVARFESMKVYSALGAVEHLLESGVVRPGDTVIDSSSGIYAYALALACHRYGLRCHIVGSTTVDRTTKIQLEILGATLEQVPPSETLKLDQTLRVHRIQEILAENPEYHWMQQYHDPVHYLGYQDFAELVGTQLGLNELSVIGAVGSGASTGGLVTALEKLGSSPITTGIQPFGSVTFGSEQIYDPEVIIAGIGSSIPFGNVHHELYDYIHWVSFQNALSGSVALLREHALFAGLSTGCAYLVARLQAEHDPGRKHLFIAPDTGHRYLEGVFARHAEASPLAALSPHTAVDLGDLRLPWTTMHWNRRAYTSSQTGVAA
jgi:cysteine synthase